MSGLAGLFRSPIGSFRAVLLLGLILGAAGLVVAALLCQAVLIPLASACLQACARDPNLMNLARGSAGLAVAAIASGLLTGLAVLALQLRATRRLVSRVESRGRPAPGRLARLAAELGIEGRLTYVADGEAYAFCYGFLSPRICLSSGMARTLSRQELRAVLLHEACHLRHRDPLKVLVSRMVAGALFLLPVAAEMRDRYLVEKELSADAAVVEQLSPRPLAGALLKICRGTPRRPGAELVAAAVGPFNLFGERIRRLAHPSEGPAPLSAGKLLMSLVVVALILLSTVGSGYAAERTLAAGGGCCASGSSCSVPAGESPAGRP